MEARDVETLARSLAELCHCHENFVIIRNSCVATELGWR